MLCKKGKCTTHIKCEKVEHFEQKFLLGGWKGYVIDERGSYACARVTGVGCMKE